MSNIGHADGRPRKHTFDINKIDYKWIEQTNKLKELKLAYDALEEDGYFPDLLRALGEKIVSLDPAFARRIDAGVAHVSAEEAAALNSELHDFFADAAKTDQQLRGAVPKDEEENMSIFSNGIAVPKDVVSPVAEQIEKKQAAENERLKGNECVKAKEYAEAVACYSRSLGLHSEEPFTYANRAMAYIKMKDYRKAIEDANTALRLKPGYVKAYHRRGKAHAALNEHELAIKDFQKILESEPENKEVNKDLMAARTLLNEKLKKETEKGAAKETAEEKPGAEKTTAEPAEKKKFVRVAIEEDSDEEEGNEGDKEAAKESTADSSKASDEPVIEEVSSTSSPTGAKWWGKQETKTTTTITSKFPLKNAKEMIEHAREAKRLMQKGGDEFMKRFNEREKQKAQAVSEDSVEDEKAKLKELEETQKKLEEELAAQKKEAEAAEAKRAKEKAEAARREQAKRE